MQNQTLSPNKLLRRQFLAAGSATVTTLVLLNSRFAQAAPLHQGDEVLSWLDQPAENPVPQIIDNRQAWEDLGKYRIDKAAWGAPIRYVEVSIDGSPWK